MSKFKLVNNVRMTPGRQMVSRIVSRMLCKQRMPGYIFPIKEELSVFRATYRNKLCLKKLLIIKRNICLWLPRKSHLLSKITDEMKDEINKTLHAGNLILGSFRKISLNIFVFSQLC